MFEWLKNIGSEDDSMDLILQHFKGMIANGKDLFDLVTTALLEGQDPATIRELVFSTDGLINKAEQQLRRELVVHMSVRGGAEFSSCLVMMSIAKDAERIGDYCKNIFDLALERPLTAKDRHYATISKVRNQVGSLLVQLKSLYDSQDPIQAKTFLREVDRVEDTCDDSVAEIIKSNDGAADNVVCALTLRYMKRVMAHSKNIATSIVMPLDKLDFFDEPKG